MKLQINEAYDYRLYGIPYRDRKRLESLGYVLKFIKDIKDIKIYKV